MPIGKDRSLENYYKAYACSSCGYCLGARPLGDRCYGVVGRCQKQVDQTRQIPGSDQLCRGCTGFKV